MKIESIKAEKLNRQTQPYHEHRVFNNWDIITDGWYIFCRSDEVKVNQVKSKNIGKQKVVVFRKSDGTLAAMDGFCPHMGVELGIGKVINNRLRCFFHHWEFGDDGKCKRIPLENIEISKKSCLEVYCVEEKYGHIWISPKFEEESSVLDVPEYEDVETTYSIGKSYIRKCHYHITMINGIDPQHLKTVHNIHMEMDVNIKKKGHRVIDIELKGKTPNTNLIEKITKFILGPDYAYSMKYADGCVASLSALKGVSFFGKKDFLPTLNMIFSYTPTDGEESLVVPIFLTKKRKGVVGFVKSQLCLLMTKAFFKALQGEDGQVYENIRFNTQNLLEIDAPVAKYIQYINKLSPSSWSSKKSY